MDGLTASEQIAYMRALSGHVLRNHKQILSAAYNLNSPFIDDLATPDDEGKYPVISDNIAIGKRGIKLTAMGGFDKVTFDGAADTYPSYCVILQVTVQNALELVHLAHQAGLITYMSAGFKFNHIADAVYSGVDGIGIGGAQILRYMDGKTGHQGPYTEEIIDRIDHERDQAANSIRGRGVSPPLPPRRESPRSTWLTSANVLRRIHHCRGRSPPPTTLPSALGQRRIRNLLSPLQPNPRKHSINARRR